MIRTAKISALAWFVVLLVVSCTKENSDQFLPDQNNASNDTAWTASLRPNATVYQLQAMLAGEPQTKTLDLATGGTITFNDGVQVTFDPASLSNAAPAPALVELVYVKTKGDIVRNFKPTISNGRLLESGGAFHLRVSQDGKVLTLAPGSHVSIRYTFPQVDDDMQLFYGDTSVPGSFNWLPDNTGSVTTFSTPDTAGVTLGYELLSSRLEWINCDKFIDTGTLTKILCVLPANFTNNNTTVFMVFHDFRSVLQLYPDAGLKGFYMEKVPLGADVTLVSISKIGETLFMATTETSVSSAQVVELTPTQTTSEAILQYLQGL